MRFSFLELPGEDGRAALARPVVPVQVEDLEEAPQLCLVDTGSTANRFGAWLAEATGIDLAGAPESTVQLGGVTAIARHARLEAGQLEEREPHAGAAPSASASVAGTLNIP